MSELLKISNLRVHFKNAAPERNAVDGISLIINEGEILGLVGESGSGKTVTAMAVSGLVPKGSAVIDGSITLGDTEILQCTDDELLKLRGRLVSVVFQEPMTAMNPTMKIGPQVEEALRVHSTLNRTQRKALALDAISMVELPNPENIYNKYPHELSGGMLQRVMIAAAIINKPRLLLADEPTTALDVTVQAQILELLKKLNAETGMTILFISHNMNVVRKLCSRVAVMKRGHIVEENLTGEIFSHPKNEYTKHLLAAIPTREHKLI